ncbi:hypothetical protein B566_EDAN002684 [Ephemera danica]|nr:hypothetical protein B566_EDAN002684 [Ephemera danica]
MGSSVSKGSDSPSLFTAFTRILYFFLGVRPSTVKAGLGNIIYLSCRNPTPCVHVHFLKNITRITLSKCNCNLPRTTTSATPSTVPEELILAFEDSGLTIWYFGNTLPTTYRNKLLRNLHLKDDWFGAWSFNISLEVNTWLAFTFLNNNLAIGLHVSRLADKFAFISHFRLVDNELMFATSKVLDLNPRTHRIYNSNFLLPVIGNNWFTLEEPICCCCLILQFNFQNQLLALNYSCVLELLVESVLV